MSITELVGMIAVAAWVLVVLDVFIAGSARHRRRMRAADRGAQLVALEAWYDEHYRPEVYYSVEEPPAEPEPTDIHVFQLYSDGELVCMGNARGYPERSAIEADFATVSGRQEVTAAAYDACRHANMYP